MTMIYRANIVGHGRAARSKGSVRGNPHGQFAVEAQDEAEAMAKLQQLFQPHDRRPLQGACHLRDGKVTTPAVGREVRLKTPYHGKVCGVIVESLRGQHFGVHLFDHKGYYTALATDPVVVDFRADEFATLDRRPKLPA